MGKLQPRFLASLNVNDVTNFVRGIYLKDAAMKKLCDFSEVIQSVYKDIQCARYEDFIIKMAEAYDGYYFYLPAFVDFRGRIYRSGVLHFHERDLARSLILFADNNQYTDEFYQNTTDKILEAAAFHFGKFRNPAEAIKFINNYIIKIYSDDSLNDALINAKRPFQFLAAFVCDKGSGCYV